MLNFSKCNQSTNKFLFTLSTMQIQEVKQNEEAFFLKFLKFFLKREWWPLFWLKKMTKRKEEILSKYLKEEILSKLGLEGEFYFGWPEKREEREWCQNASSQFDPKINEPNRKPKIWKIRVEGGDKEEEKEKIEEMLPFFLSFLTNKNRLRIIIQIKEKWKFQNGIPFPFLFF